MSICDQTTPSCDLFLDLVKVDDVLDPTPGQLSPGGGEVHSLGHIIITSSAQILDNISVTSLPTHSELICAVVTCLAETRKNVKVG